MGEMREVGVGGFLWEAEVGASRETKPATLAVKFRTAELGTPPLPAAAAVKTNSSSVAWSTLLREARKLGPSRAARALA